VSRREPKRDGLGRETYLLADLVAGRLTAGLDAVCRAEGITAAQYPVLWVLCLADEAAGIPQGAISDDLVTRTADVSRLVSRLVAAGLVARVPSPVDRRIALVRPTVEGRRVFERVTDGVKALHREQFADLDDAELRTLHDLLNRVLWTGGHGPR
jgi:DNA-binding MarR family transcriptional regulator